MRNRWLVFLVVLGVVGCSAHETPPQAKNNLRSSGLAIRNFHEPPGQHEAAEQTKHKQAVAGMAAPQNAVAAPAAPVTEPRKIIYIGTIELLVDRLDQAEQHLQQILQEQGGYIASSHIIGSPGSPRSGTWTLRVPVARFDALREGILALGEMQENKIDSNDITDEFYDLRARIKNKQQEEARLQELLKKSPGNLKDVLLIEEHLTRVQGDIEQMQGQMQRWDKETALATLTVVLNDRKDYVPPTVPDFATSIGRTFGGSVDNLVGFGRGVVLVIAAVAPWIALLAIVAVPFWFLWRRAKRRLLAPPQESV